MYEIFLKLLNEKGVTAYKVGKATGIAGSTFTDWKNGRSVPKQEKLQKIADYFGVSLDYLRGNSNTIECPECGFKYDLLDSKSRKEHERIHELMEEAKTKYGFYYNEEYCNEMAFSNLDTVINYHGNIDINDKIYAYIEYLKCDFSDLLRANHFKCTYDSFDDFVRAKILDDIHEPFMSVDMSKILCERYNVDTRFSNENASLLASISKNKQLMRLITYVQKLNPETLNSLEIQIKALAEQEKKE